MWWKSAVNFSFFLCLAACRMRSSAWATTFPVLCPVRAVLIRIPLGSRPSLLPLRRRQAGFVRRLHRYYGGIRLLMIVHHRLRLLAFPMRTNMGLCHAGQSRASRFPCKERPCMPGSATTPGRTDTCDNVPVQVHQPYDILRIVVFNQEPHRLWLLTNDVNFKR